MNDPGESGRSAALSGLASTFARTIIDAVRREYPNHLRHVMNGPDDRPTPREVHPAFYGCFDWHSAVEMHWALVRLLRVAPTSLDAGLVRAVLDSHLTPEHLQTEADYFRANTTWERPYGWGWALTLADELAGWVDDDDAGRWSTNLRPLADVLTDAFVRWLPRVRHPTRDGLHTNSAFGCVRAMAWARRRAADGEPALLEAISDAATRWFGEDVDYPAAWEPGGADFLSPALTESEMMLEVLGPGAFPEWFDRFLPGFDAGEPANLMEPVSVTDPADGQGAHLHGLNLYRAAAFRHLAEAVAGDDRRRNLWLHAAERHEHASLPAVSGSDYMIEHWLAAYAVLALS